MLKCLRTVIYFYCYVQLTVNAWKGAATNWKSDRGTIFAIRDGIVKTYTKDGFTEVSITMANVPWINPPIKETNDLNTWMHSQLAE